MDVNSFMLQFNIYTKNGGVVSDLSTHWSYIQLLREDFLNLFATQMGVGTNLINFPFHNMVISQLYFLADNIKFYLFFYFCFSLTIPYLFYLCLVERFNKQNRLILILISSLIYLLPAFQYSAIWGNSHITSLFFFLIGVLFHLKLRNYNYNKKKYFFISIVFLALATYSKQFYVFFFLFIFLEFFLKVKFKFFLFISIFTSILSIPGFLFLIKNPLLFFGIKQNITNFSSSILISSSICFFYLIPFIIQYLINNFRNVKKIFNIKLFITSFLIFIICVPFFNYNSDVGGGIFFKLFFKILKQEYLFFLFSLLGIYFILFFTKKNIFSYLLSILLLCTFSTGYYIFQKYFEPMFLIIFFLYFDTNKIKNFLTKNFYIPITYFLSYFVLANYIYFFGI